MTAPFRRLAGSAALAAGAALLTLPATAAPPELPAASYKRAADADLAFLRKRLGELAAKDAAGGKLLDGQVKPALGVALLLSVYGDALGDGALKADSLKTAEAIAKKDFKAADELAKKLTVKPGVPGQGGALPRPFKDEVMLAATMSPFRGGSVGGLNIDRDIKDMIKVRDPKPIDPAAVEVLAVRTAVISAFAEQSPDEKARAKPNNLRTWEKWSRDSVEASKQLVEEAAKGKSADEKKLKTLLTTLNARCTDCHNTGDRGD